MLLTTVPKIIFFFEKHKSSSSFCSRSRPSMEFQQLLFPVASFDGAPLQHKVSAILRGRDYLVTGSTTGELVYWKPIEPKSVRATIVPVVS